jgi:Glycine-zipper domain
MPYSFKHPNPQLPLLLAALLAPAGFAQQAAPATPPAAHAPAPAAAQGSLSQSLGVFVFPAKNQDSTQQSNDEAACYGWAKTQTNIDPMNIKPPEVAQPSEEQKAAAENAGNGSRARGAARGAAGGAIIGAIAGDAGTGAAAGAAAGTMAGGAAKRQAKRQAASQQEQQQAAAQQQAQAAIAQQKATYNKAFSACMEGKGYTVK